MCIEKPELARVQAASRILLIALAPLFASSFAFFRATPAPGLSILVVLGVGRVQRVVPISHRVWQLMNAAGDRRHRLSYGMIGAIEVLATLQLVLLHLLLFLKVVFFQPWSAHFANSNLTPVTFKSI